MHVYDDGLQRCNANFTPLTPVDLLLRAPEIYGDKTAVLYGRVRRTWRQTFKRCVRLASALAQMGVQHGNTVAVVLPNNISGRKAFRASRL
jgi:fatty-acyl-CoA synthase